MIPPRFLNPHLSLKKKKNPQARNQANTKVASFLSRGMSPRGTAPGVLRDPVLGGPHAGVVPGSGGWDGKVAAGFPGRVFSRREYRDGVPRGDPTPRDSLARFGVPRGSVHGEFRCESRLWRLPRPPLHLVSFQGSWSAPHPARTPPPTEAPTLSLRGPKAGARGGVLREQGGREGVPPLSPAG